MNGVSMTETGYSETAKQKAASSGLELLYTEKGLTLTDGVLSMTGDFESMLSRIAPSKLSGELLVKAAKLKNPPEEHPLAIDATAGMGEDSLLLAAAGFRVLMIEYDPVIAALLKDTLARASVIPSFSGIVSRMSLLCGDSIRILSELSETPSVVYLDPMFPKRKKSGLIKKKFQLLQKLECPCASEEALLSAARLAHPKKVIIKRPLKGPFLAGVKPDYSLSGKSIRYDCIVSA